MLNVSVPWEEVLPFLHKAAQRQVQRKPIAGFRPQATPYALVKERVGEEALLQDAVNAVVSDSFVRALHTHALETLGRPEITPTKVGVGDTLEYHASVAVLPKVTLALWKDIKVQKKLVAATTKEVQDALEGLQKIRRTEEAVPRAATLNDKVVVDLDISLEGVPLEGGQARNHGVYLAEPYYLPGLNEALVGLTAGESKTFPLSFPATHYQKHLQGRTVECKAKIVQVAALTTPPLDDALAVKLGLKDIASLTKLMEENIEAEKRMQEEARAEEELFDTLMRQSTFEKIPEMLIASEGEKMAEELFARAAAQGMEKEAYLASIGKTTKELEKEFIPRAEVRIKAALLLREVAQQEKLQGSPEELTRAAALLLKKTCLVPENAV